MLSTEALEFANCNPRYLQKPYRFVYSFAFTKEPDEVPTCLDPHLIVKVDTATGRTLTWALEGYSASEPQFVPRPDGEEEDDGVLLVPANDIAAEKSWLLVLDAKDLREVARLSAPIEINTGLHNMYIPDKPTYALKN
jgi:torulene dioxygenase